LSLHASSENELLGSAFVLKIIGAFSALLFTIITCLVVESSHHTQMLIMAAALSLLVHPLMIFEFYFRSTIHSEYFAWSMMGAMIISAALRILFILNAMPVIYFAVVPAVELLVTVFGLAYFYWRQGKRPCHWRCNMGSLKQLLNESWPLLFSGAMISIYMRIDQVMIQHMLDAQAVGYYSAAVRISEAWYFIPGVICQSVLPSIVITRDVDRVQYEKRLQSLFRFMVLISFSVAIPATFLSGHLVTLLYGTTYSPSVGVFRIHVWAGIFVSVGVAVSNWLLAENLQKYYLVIVTFGVLTNVSANLILIKTCSFYGAAWATVLSYFVSGFFCLSFFRTTRPCFKMIAQSFLIHRYIMKGTKNV
ncbi:MAG: flippase, partial [Desulfatitalea sp.]|nr:flippase [Desulfatitalea sp.]